MSFEGGEGVGKSTQVVQVQRFLENLGYPCLATREPGGTPLGEKLRELFLSPPGEQNISHVEELLMMMAARACHVRQVIMPALEKGLWVLCDRYVDSTLVYQGLLQGVDPQALLQVHEAVGINLLPQRTYVLLRNAEEDVKRRSFLEGPNRFDDKPLSFHKAVAQGFQSLVQLWPQRLCAMTSSGDVETITALICQDLVAAFPELGDRL